MDIQKILLVTSLVLVIIIVLVCIFRKRETFNPINVNSGYSTGASPPNFYNVSTQANDVANAFISMNLPPSLLSTDAVGNLKTVYNVPIGSIIMWGGDSQHIPDGWALCDGSTHTVIFSDGSSSQLIVPNLGGFFPVGAGSGSSFTSGYAVGDIGGTETTLTPSTYLPAASVQNALASDAIVISSVNSVPQNNLPPFYALSFIIKIRDGPASSS